MTHPLARALLGVAAIAAATALAGCNADDITPTGRAMAPLSPKTAAEIQSKNMDPNSPLLVRVFKEEAELEVWKQNREGQYALLKTYPICRWSGDLGPKKKEGDRQAPEGFYTITPGQMNPNSNYYLAFNTGFPNAYDRSHGYSGSELMVHGDCSSRGCYAMTDEQIQEIYALARDAFFGGQREFQFEAFPFRMTALNLAKHRNNPNFTFWKMLKQGYDDFEATHQEPKVAVCEKHYVFDAAPPPGVNGPLHFSPSGKCPAHQLDPTIASAVTDYRHQEDVKLAGYISRGTPTSPPHVGDGGMNPVFMAELTGSSSDNDGRYSVASLNLQPGVALPKVPRALPHVPNPPGTTIPKVGAALAEPAKKPQPASQPASQPAPADQSSEPVMMASVPVPEPAPLPKEGQAPAEQQPANIASLFGNLFNASKTQPQPAPVVTAAADANAPVTLRGTNTDLAAKPKVATAPKMRAASAPVALHAKVQKAPPKPTAVAKTEPAAKPAPKQTAQQAAPEPKRPEPEIRTAYSAQTPSNGLLSGAQPVMPAGSFNSRWSALR